MRIFWNGKKLIEVPKRQAEQLAIRAAQDFDAFYRNRLCPPEDTDHLMVLSFDGKGIAMLHRDLREATRKAADAAPRHPETRLTKGGDRDPTNKRVWASVEHSAQHVIDDAFEEALRRDPERRRRWVVLVDGNEDQLARIRSAARRSGSRSRSCSTLYT